ncbi:MAG: polysaccharide pyruvyl transferase family protein [Flavobacteriaceae bacterium]
MKYGLLKYWEKETNIGDYIQSIAAKQFLPRVDEYVYRDQLHNVKSNLNVIMNGWFMHETQNWPPNNSLIPKFVSFHISDHVVNALTNSKSIEYYKKHEPIGCRDYHTQKILEGKGIKAYFSGCLTLTLKKENFLLNKSTGIIFSDILQHKDDAEERSFLWKIKHPHKIIINGLKNTFKSIKAYSTRHQTITKLIPKDIIAKAKLVSNQNTKIQGQTAKFSEAERLLKIYANAELVVTSRIHVALPCLAFGTPVIFIQPDRAVSRFEGISNLFNTFTLDQIKNTSKKELQELFIDSSKTIKTDHIKLREALINDLESYFDID